MTYVAIEEPAPKIPQLAFILTTIFVHKLYSVHGNSTHRVQRQVSVSSTVDTPHHDDPWHSPNLGILQQTPAILPTPMRGLARLAPHGPMMLRLSRNPSAASSTRRPLRSLVGHRAPVLLLYFSPTATMTRSQSLNAKNPRDNDHITSYGLP